MTTVKDGTSRATTAKCSSPPTYAGRSSFLRQWFDPKICEAGTPRSWSPTRAST